LIDFEQALTTLAEDRVWFVIVGGLAVTIHTSSYVTSDLDFNHARDRGNPRSFSAPFIRHHAEGVGGRREIGLSQLAERKGPLR
jgi:hypothetical protein